VGDRLGGRIQLLERLEAGEVNIEQAIAGLEAGAEVRPVLRGWWILPFAVGMALAGGGGALALQGGWWWPVAAPLLAAGACSW
jgi:hypothetical protein